MHELEVAGDGRGVVRLVHDIVEAAVIRIVVSVGGIDIALNEHVGVVKIVHPIVGGGDNITLGISDNYAVQRVPQRVPALVVGGDKFADEGLLLAAGLTGLLGLGKRLRGGPKRLLVHTFRRKVDGVGGQAKLSQNRRDHFLIHLCLSSFLG